MRVKLLLFALLLMFSANFQISDAAQTYVPERCGNIHGGYYRPDLFPQFKDTHNRLVLANWHTGQTVMTLAESLPYRYRFEWSPDCRYLIGFSLNYKAWLSPCDAGLFVWDTVSGAQKLALNSFCDDVVSTRPHIFWRPDGSAALFSEWYSVGGLSGSYGKRFIWYPESNQRVDLQDGNAGAAFIGATLDPIAWDDSRGWLWTGTIGGIAVFDMHSGAVVRTYLNPPKGETSSYYTSSSFVFSLDQTKVIAYGQHSYDGHESEAMTVYDIA